MTWTDTDAAPSHVIYADILTERIDRPIGVNIYAHDGDGRSEEPVFFELRNNKPIPRNDGHVAPLTGNPAYLLTQLQQPGFFRDEDYGNRTGVDHIFKFGHSTKMAANGMPVRGFSFAHDFLERLVEDGFTIDTSTVNGAEVRVTTVGDKDHLFGVSETAIMDTRVYHKRPAASVSLDLGAIYYEAEVGGPITQSNDDVVGIDNFIQGNAETSVDNAQVAITTLETGGYPEIKFRFNSVGTGTVKITFGVWASAPGQTPRVGKPKRARLILGSRVARRSIRSRPVHRKFYLSIANAL